MPVMPGVMGGGVAIPVASHGTDHEFGGPDPLADLTGYPVDAAALTNLAAIVLSATQITGVVEAKVAAYNVLAGDRGKVLTNVGAGIQVPFNLPAAAAGLGPFHFYSANPLGLAINAAAGDTIRVGLGTGGVTPAAGSISPYAPTQVGHFVTFFCLNATEWIAMAVRGRWIGAQAMEGRHSPGGLDEMALSWAGASDLEIEVGSCRDSLDRFDIVAASALPIDLTVVGAGGRDAGAFTADTWWHAFAIAKDDGSPPAGLASTSRTAPVLPAGYVFKRRLGSSRSNGAGALERFFQRGGGRDRKVLYNNDVPDTRVLSNGTSAAFASVDCSDWIPDGATLGIFSASGDGGTTPTDWYFRPDGSALDRVFQINTSNTREGYFEMITSVARAIEYKRVAGDDGLYLDVRGYWEKL